MLRVLITLPMVLLLAQRSGAQQTASTVTASGHVSPTVSIRPLLEPASTSPSRAACVMTSSCAVGRPVCSLVTVAVRTGESQDMFFTMRWDPLQCRHNERDGVSNHQPHDCYSTVNSGVDQRKHQSSASLAFVRGNSPHKGPVTRNFFHLITSSCAKNTLLMTTTKYKEAVDNRKIS